MKARFGLYMGEVTNNVAEYEGLIRAMQHAVDNAVATMSACFWVDSLLVCKQVRGEWGCRNIILQPFHESCVTMLRQLRALYQNVSLEHVYREFNVEADSAANEAIDADIQQKHTSHVVINENWEHV